MPSGRAYVRHWTWTLFDYTDEIISHFRRVFENGSICRYAIFGYETCPKTGKPHLQGYCAFNERKTRASVKRLLKSNKLHCDPTKGSPEENRRYCSKTRDEDENPNEKVEEFGKLPKGSGQRTDLESVIEKIQEGASLQQVIETCPLSYIRYNRGIEKLWSRYCQPRSWKTEVFVFWGEAGTGKSRKAWELAGPEAWSYPATVGGQRFFPGYEGQENVIFDDFNGSWFSLTTFLNLTDRYQCIVEVKGSHVQWKPKKIFITSNFRYQDWYQCATPTQLQAIRRRITDQEHFAL